MSEAVLEVQPQAVVIKADMLPAAAEYLKNNPETDCALLADITAVDYWDYIEVVYRLSSIEKNQNAVLKVRCERAHPETPSLTGIWKGADLMEREVFDLMGVQFRGHPNMKRLFLWEGFQGNPLRKDYI